MKKGYIFFLSLLLILPIFGNAQIQRSQEFKEKYNLKEVVVMSRHNIRSPLSGNGSVLGNMTPHKWITWTSAPSELTLRGGILETMMGQFFRKWLIDENLFSENHVPNKDEVNFYANSMQRTIATAQYFSSGFMPVANIAINHRFAPSKMDPVFFPQLTKTSNDFIQKANEQINAMGGKNGIEAINKNLESSYKLITHVLDMKESPAYLAGEIKEFNNHDTKIFFEKGKEPAMKGSLKLANSASDAFILQYYEENDANRASFGHQLSLTDWENIAKVKDVYGDILFAAPIVAYNVAHPLLMYINDELNASNRKFTFLCGHDSNIASVTAALEVEKYELPFSIEKKTPIGSKLVFEKWTDKEGKAYIAINMVYQSTEQLKKLQPLDLNTPPMVYPLQLKGIETNADRLYPFEKIQHRFEKAINAYDSIR